MVFDLIVVDLIFDVRISWDPIEGLRV
jgi:hypothetical protein